LKLERDIVILDALKQQNFFTGITVVRQRVHSPSPKVIKEEYILVSFLVVNTNTFTGMAHAKLTAHPLILQGPQIRGYFVISHVIFPSLAIGMETVQAHVLSHFQQDSKETLQ